VIRNGPKSMTRRRFVGALGASGLTLGASRHLRAAQPTNVIVLGAGLAGLYTAMLLEELGVRVILLEASDHVGGRVQTRKIDGTLHDLRATSASCMRAYST